jgi:hypothetical protein
MIQNHGNTRDSAGSNPVRRQEERISGAAYQCPKYNLDIGKQNLSNSRPAFQNIVKTPEQENTPFRASMISQIYHTFRKEARFNDSYQFQAMRLPGISFSDKPANQRPVSGPCRSKEGPYRISHRLIAGFVYFYLQTNNMKKTCRR